MGLFPAIGALIVVNVMVYTSVGCAINEICEPSPYNIVMIILGSVLSILAISYYQISNKYMFSCCQQTNKIQQINNLNYQDYNRPYETTTKF